MLLAYATCSDRAPTTNPTNIIGLPAANMSRASAIRLAILALIWGSNFLFIKVSLDGLSPAEIVLARMAAGALVLLVVVHARHDSLPRRPGVWAHLLIATAVANLIPYFLFGWGEERIPSSIAGALNATTPLFTLLLALATRTERTIETLRAVGLAIGFGGVVVITAPWQHPPSSVAGTIACLLAAASYGLSYVYMRRYLANQGHSALTLAAAQLTTGALVLALTAPLTDMRPITLNPKVLASVLALGILGTGVAYVLNYRLIQDEGATSASAVTYLLPVVAVIAGGIVLNEPLTWNLYIGTAVVLLGVALSENRFRARTRRNSRQRQATEPAQRSHQSGPPTAASARAVRR